MERRTLHIEDLNGHGTARILRDLIDSLKKTGGLVACRLATKTKEHTALVKLVYDADHNSFILDVRTALRPDENRGPAELWEGKAAYSQGREEMAALDFIREVFEAEGRDELVA